ncbi:MAG: exo-alpha-sialidase, partial [Planctomycetes bacterium]|nr:exo-alpha-sialidase [Planctomycetota bacterium]
MTRTGPCRLLFAGLLATLAPVALGASADSPPDGSLQAPRVILEPGPEFADEVRMFQGIPGIERSPGGRLWVTWYGGGVTEDRHNYVLLTTSGDNGVHWSGVNMIIDPDGDGPCRAFDPCLWHDPSGRLWLFWAQRDRGVHLWAMVTENSDEEEPSWSPPRLVCEGIMMCKPTVTSTGQWLLPVALWRRDGSATAVSSEDRGVTWKTLGRANVPKEEDRNCDEAMIVQRGDGSLWMLVRTNYGIGETVSTDEGRTWSDVAPSKIGHATARFFVRRLRSGNLLLVKHGPIDERTDRSRLTAYLSDDDGNSWHGGLMIDARRGVSYPDAVQSPEGTIYLVYDYSRTGAKQILVAIFTEKDVEEGRCVTEGARLRVLANQATGVRPAPELSFQPNSDGVEFQPCEAAEFSVVEGKEERLARGAELFSDRSYVVGDLPKVLEGKRFVYGSIDRIRAVCTKTGTAYVITPSKGRNNDSLEPSLIADGFRKTNLPEFLLFGDSGGNVCSLFQKRLDAGDVIEFGKWGVLT